MSDRTATGGYRKGPATQGYQALLFDLDGTVLDTKELILASYHYAAEKVLGYRLPDGPLLEMVGVPLPEQMYTLAPEGSAVAMIEAYREHNSIGHDRYVNYFPGTREALAKLEDSGWPMAIVTSKRNDSARQGLKSFDLEGFFSLLIGFDDSDRHKPDPTPLLLAAERLGVRPEHCIYIGDSPYDMQAATAAAMLAVGVSWGFFTAARLSEAGAQVTVGQISDLPDTINHL